MKLVICFQFFFVEIGNLFGFVSVEEKVCDSKGIDHSRISKPRTRVPLIQFLSKSTMSASGSAVSKILKPSLRPKIQPTDVQAAAMWGVAAATTAFWIVQPFDWLKKTFFEKPEPEAK